MKEKIRFIKETILRWPSDRHIVYGPPGIPVSSNEYHVARTLKELDEVYYRILAEKNFNGRIFIYELVRLDTRIKAKYTSHPQIFLVPLLDHN